jgi:hypothetical protein
MFEKDWMKPVEEWWNSKAIISEIYINKRYKK